MLTKKLKKVVLMLATVTAIESVGGAIGGTPTYAGSKSFSGVKFTAGAHVENWKKVVTRTKPNDGDIGWYVTFTSISGSGYVKKHANTRVLVASSRKSGYNNSDSELWPIAKETMQLPNGNLGYQHVPYKKAVQWNKNYSMYFVGNQNNKKSYTITASGRYSS